MQVVVDGTLTAYSVVGSSSKTILCLHGWADKGATFTALADQLVADYPQHQIVLVDLPGFGATQAPATAWNIPEYAQFVAHFIKKTQLDITVLIGHSNGGAIAIYAVAHKLVQPQQLVLIGSAGIREATAKKTALKILSKPAKLAIKVAPQKTQRRIKEKVYGAIGSDYVIAEHMQDTFKNIVSYDIRADAQSVAIPTLLLYGADDTATPPQYGTMLADIISGSKCVVLPNATHFVHQEQVYKVATHIGNHRKEVL